MLIEARFPVSPSEAIVWKQDEVLGPLLQAQPAQHPTETPLTCPLKHQWHSPVELTFEDQTAG